MRKVVVLLAVMGCNEPAKTDAPAPAPAPAAVSASAIPSVAMAASAPKTAPDSISAQHVLVAFKGTTNAPKTLTRSRDEAKKRAEEVVAKAKAGEDFSTLVSTYSDDAGTKDRQGSLGKFGRDKMVKAFSDAAFALAVGEVSAPVETPFGFHVIKRNQ